MSRAFLILLLLPAFFVGRNVRREHGDYVPDQKTAGRIAEAVLIDQYGEERVRQQLPLHIDGSDKDLWMVQGVPAGEEETTGGGFTVWINKHSGCIEIVTEHMK